MITILIVLLSNEVFCNSEVEEQTVTVTNFHDYSIHMKKAGDKLYIITPANTLVFISSLDGYDIVGIAQGLMPNPKRRLYYTYKSGFMTVYSTIDNLDFHFHSLVLDKIDFPIENIFVSSSPSEEFKIKTADSYSDTNATFGENNLIWFLGKSKSSCRVGTTVYDYYLDAMHNYKNFYVYPSYYAFPFSDPSNQSKIEFNHISLGLKQYMNIESYSKLFYIKKVDMLAPNIDSHLTIFCRPTELSNDYYSDYRSYIKNPSTFLENQYIDRGQYHYHLPQLYTLIGDGEIFELDFSIVNQIKTHEVRNIFIFPKLSKMTTSFIFNDTVLLLFRNFENIHFESGTKNFVDESDINVKCISYNVGNDFMYDITYIISTIPTEKLKIGPKIQDDVNYTNDKTYKYIMASLQDIQTKIIFTANVSFHKFSLGNLEKVNIDSGDTIDGPFVALIGINSVCEFETYPIGELKEGYLDNGSAIFHCPLYADRSFYFSTKYGKYYDKIYERPNETIDDFNDKGYSLVATSNLLYIQTQNGWRGEVVFPYFEDNKIGPEYNRTSFYFSQISQQRVYIMFEKLNSNENYKINFRTSTLKSCSRVIMFNELPIKFSFNQDLGERYREINANEKDITCFFPALSYFYYGGNNTYFYHANGVLADSSSTITNNDYCKYINLYNYYGDDTYVIGVNKYATKKAVLSFIDYEPSSNYFKKDLGVLPDEPKIYYDFKVSEEYGIHSLGSNKYSPLPSGNDSDDFDEPDDGDGDDDDKDEEYLRYEYIETRNCQSSFDTNGVYNALLIRFQSEYIFIIHSMKGLIAKVYGNNSDNDLIATIDEYSENKVIKIPYNGRIEIRKKNAKRKTKSDSLDEIFVYSGISMDRQYLLNTQCKKIFISTSTNSVFSIISSDLENPNIYDLNLSNKDNFCLWFVSPIELTIKFEYSLPHYLYLYENSFSNLHNIDPSDNEYDGNNLFFLLYPSNENSNSGTATFHVSPKNTNDLNSDYYQVDHVFNIEGQNGIIDPNDNSGNNPNELNPTSQPSKPKSNIIGIVVSIIIALIVIIVIIVVTVKCVKKHKKKKTNSSDENSDPVKI